MSYIPSISKRHPVQARRREYLNGRQIAVAGLLKSNRLSGEVADLYPIGGIQ